MSYVLNLAELDRTQVSRVGGKNANLGEMIRVGIQVPLGFAVSVDAYHRFVEREGVGERIEYLLTEVDVEDPGGLEEKSGEIRELILNSGMPDDVAREIRASYGLSLIHISEPTRRTPISYAVFCLKKKK